MKIKNIYERACEEWLKGCSCASSETPEDCKECTDAFLKCIKSLNKGGK